MMLVYPEYNINLDIKENRVNVLVVENPKIMTELLRELYKQNSGVDGRFVLSENNKILRFEKMVYIMPNLFQLDCNDRKVLNHLYQNLDELAVENLTSEGIQLNAEIVKHLNRICEQVPYNLEFKSQFLPTELLKLGAVQFVKEASSLLEEIIQYIDIINKLFAPRLIVFLNLKLYLSRTELEQLYEFVFYHKIDILLIEGQEGERNLKEDTLIIDKDQCTINI